MTTPSGSDKDGGRSRPEEGGESSGPSNFIREIIDHDLQNRVNEGRLATRFPPEPNGYLHIGHAKAICVNFGLAAEFGGTCNLRFDDTNPSREEVEFVESIQEDIRWLGFDWEDRLHYASDYFEQLYQWAEKLITEDKAFVDSLSNEEVSQYRGNFYTEGKASPNRDRPVEQSLDLFRRMRAGEFADGELVLRAKVDVNHPNMKMRDPVMYRILAVPHHRTGDAWCIYPLYDFTHGQSDAIEGITHSLCSLEFKNHRDLYDWFLDQIEPEHRPRQIEFARLNLSYTVLSKRRLLKLLEEGRVSGWDDPRMPTLRGMRRRGIPPAAIRKFCDRIGVSRRNGVVDVSLLEHAVREDLNQNSPRVMAVLDPLKLVITNYPEDSEELFEAQDFPNEPERGTRMVPFSRELFIERDDFREDPPKKFFRLAPGREIRLRYACLITCDEVIKDPQSGEVIELHCTWDPDSRGGNAPDGRRVKGTSHWVSARHAVPAEVRIYDRLFSVENPLGDKDVDFTEHLNPSSHDVLTGCQLEPVLAGAEPGNRYQFERLGYFCVDNVDSTPERLVFNRTITLRDSWAKIAKQQKQQQQAQKKQQQKSKNKKNKNKKKKKQHGPAQEN